MKHLAIIALVSVLLSGCRQASFPPAVQFVEATREVTREVPMTVQVTRVVEMEQRMSDEDLASLRQELEIVRAEIELAEEKDRLYTGGLIKALIASRVEILKTVEALILARLQAAEAGAKVVVEVRATQPDLTRAGQLKEEIAAKQRELEEARQEAAKYSGGLVQGLALATVATTEQTIAMLKQEYLIAQYGLDFPIVAGQVSEGQSIEAVPPEPAEPTKILEIVDVDARVTESNETWSKFAWKLTVKNLTDRHISFQGTVEFLDGDGFVVDDDVEYNLSLGPNEERTFTGYDLIDASVAGNVSGIGAKVGAR